MHSFPTEIISYICQLSCTDDGRTFRALQLASRYLYEITVPMKYHALVIDSINEARTVLDRLNHIQGPHLRKIHHLFLCTDDTEESRRPWSTSAVLSIVARLLLLASPTLRTLTVAASPKYCGTAVIAQIFRTSFPVLEEMTIVGMYPYPVASIPLAPRDINITSPRTNFPRLQRLHLNGNPNPHGLLQLRSMPTVFPSLTHLRISQLGNAEVFLGELEEEMRVLQIMKDTNFQWDGEVDEIHVQPCLPATLRSVEIQFGAAAPNKSLSGGRSRNREQQQRDIIARMEKTFVESTMMNGCVSFFAHPPMDFKDNDALRSLTDAKSQWRDRLRGRNGCWKSSKW